MLPARIIISYFYTFGFYARLSSRLTLLTHAYGAEGVRSKWVRFVLGECINLYKGLLIQEKSTGKKGMKGDGRWKKGM